MQARIVRIGNSRGIRIPKALLEHTGLAGAVEILVRKDRLILRRTKRARTGWAEAFRAMARAGDDRLADAGRLSLTRPQRDEWEWR
jgi:antitoxin MazE